MWSLILMFILSINHSNTQITPERVRLQDSLSIKYFNNINLALREIYKNDFEKAGEYYKKAFFYKKSPFYCDIKNAILVNCKTGNYKDNNALLKILLQDKGVDTSALFHVLPRRIFDQDNINHINKIKKLKKVNKINTELQKQLNEIFNIDQEVRAYDQIAKSLPEFRDSVRNRVYFKRDSVDEVNVIKFANICNKYGYPGEDKIGVFKEGHYEWSNAIYILMLHFRNSNLKNEILEISRKAMEDGTLHPSLYANLMESFYHDNKSLVGAYNYMNTTMLKSGEQYFRPIVYYSDSLMIVVNTNRISIGLDSFHIAQKLAVCSDLCPKMRGTKDMIAMTSYPSYSEYSLGFIKYALEQEKVDINLYLLNINKMLDACDCQKKAY